MSQNQKKITVRTQDGASYNLILESNDDFATLVNKLTRCVCVDQDENITPKFTFVYKGKIIDADKFNEIENGSILLCIVSFVPKSMSLESETSSRFPSEIPSTETSETPSSETPSTETSETPLTETPLTETPLTETPLTETSKEEQYSYKQVKASLVVFLDFVKNNTQLKNLYWNDYKQLVNELILNPDIDTIIRNILGQSGRIMGAMEKGENIKININGSTGKVDKIDLNQNDEEIIMELIDLGFDPTKAISAYIESGYNKDAAISRLLNS